MSEYDLINEFFEVLNKLDWLTSEEKDQIAEYVDNQRMIKGKGAGKPLGIGDLK